MFMNRKYNEFDLINKVNILRFINLIQQNIFLQANIPIGQLLD